MANPSTRPRLIPRWVVWVVACTMVVAAVLGGILYRVQSVQSVSVPNVVGLDLTVARSRLAEKGLLLAKGDNRFSSTVPVGGILGQTPAAGTQVERNTPVTVIVSAGSESFALPEVTGMPLQLARTLLQEKGLTVQTEVVPSDRPKNQVVSSLPGAGVTVSASDTIKLSVSSGGKGPNQLQPADLSGKTFVIDPLPVSAGTTDTPMEVERRLNSLLGASGAKVVVTRSVTDASITAALREQRARAASATAVIGLDMFPSGPEGISVSSLKSAGQKPASYLGSLQISQALVTTLNAVHPGVKTSEVAADDVLRAAGAPGVRIRLGSLSQSTDRADFSDPVWSDAVARAIYAAVGSVYGSR